MTNGQATREAYHTAHPHSYTRAERSWLIILAVFGLVVVNGVFVYAAIFQAGTLAEAMRNPIASAFIVEALVLTWALAFLLRKWGVSRLHPGWFVFLSLLGSMAFALPVALLWHRGGRVTPPRE